MKPMSRLVTASAATALAVGALLVPATAQAAPILAEDATSSACVVTGGDLTWGVKESFRSYISGTIAHGSWEVSDGATYETPMFGWSNPTGEIDASTGEGTVSFNGLIHFTGHDGALNLQMSNPSIQFSGDGTAQLLLDTTSQRANGEIAIDEEQAYIGKIEGIGDIDPSSGEVAFVDAPAVLTADGADAFGGFYGSGDDLDPITLTLQLVPCEAAGGSDSGAEDQGANDEQITTQVPAEQSVPWLPIALGGVAVVVIVVTAGMLIAGRKKNVED